MIAVLVLGAWTELAQATEEVVVQVAQPVWAEGDWFLAMTAYVDMQGSRVPGYNLGLITRPNRMPVREEFEQRNAAYDQGIEIRTDTRGGNAGLYGDTLRAELDLTQLKKPTDPYGAEIEPDLIRKTVDSILVTAWFDRFGYNPERGGLVSAKWLDLKVIGDSRYRTYGHELPRLWDALSHLTP